MEEDLALVTYAQLKSDFGIPYGRTHLFQRLIPEGKFPKCFALVDDPKGRKYWYRSVIRNHLKKRGE